MRDLTIYTSGCIRPDGIGGWAYVAINCNEDGTPFEYYGAETKTTNNRMELTAAINALGIVPRGKFATIVTDSQYVQRCFARRCWPDSKPNADLGRWLSEMKNGRNINIELIKGHSGNPHNDRAHELANNARLVRVATEKERAARPPTALERIVDTEALTQAPIPTSAHTCTTLYENMGMTWHYTLRDGAGASIWQSGVPSGRRIRGNTAPVEANV